MAKCKDCLHYEACSDFSKIINAAVDVEKGCEHFKDRTQFAEVVRCKGCMWARPKNHREPTDTPREFICQCLKHHYIPAPWGARMAVKADDFCSYGERRTDNA